MTMSSTPPRRNWKLGFTLALVTALLWGLLPIALKVALTELDAWTITWCRFAGAMLTMGVLLAVRGQLPRANLFDSRSRRWLIIGSLGLTGNYVLYVLGLSYSSPAVAQTVMQIAPLLLLVFGTLVFHERFSRLQWIGFAGLVFGLVIFFNRRLPELLHPAEGWSLGIFLIAISATSWAIYGVSQKKLLGKLNSAQILFLIYIVATLILLPTAHFGALVNLNRPVVIAGSSEVHVRPVMEDHDEVFVTFDGQSGFPLRPGDQVTVRRAPRPVRIVKSAHRSYFDVLREKLKWGGDNR